MKNLSHYNAHRIPCAISNLSPYLRAGACIEDIYDAVEDSNTDLEFKSNINKLLDKVCFEIDRVTASYVRLKRTDRLGNVEYLRAEF